MDFETRNPPDERPLPDPRAASFAGSVARRRLQWLGLAALVPLLALLTLQYLWLADLERTSAIARQAELESYLGQIAKDVHKYYKQAAYRALNLPATLLEPKYVHKVAWFFKKNGDPAASRLFVMNFQDEVRDRLLLFDREQGEMVVAEDFTPEVRAIYMATAPWHVVVKKGEEVADAVPVVDERDPEHRMILHPILDESSKLAGIAGMIVDPAHFRERLLPRLIEDARPAFPRTDELVVSVIDPAEPARAGGGLKAGEGATVEAADAEAQRYFSFLFKDWRLAARGRTSTSEQWARTNFALNMTLSLVLGAALLAGLVWVLRTAAREMRVSEMKNDFVSNVSHELRTPLASIRVFGELLRLGRVRTPEKVREYGETIETESRRLTQLINNILDFSRIESGRREYDLEPTDLGEVVADVAKTLEVRLRRSGFELEVRGLDAPLPPIRLDRDALRQALFNLLDNAVKYSGDGRRIAVHLRRRGRWAVVAVEDRGLGISRRDQSRIFERFHRVGTGLVHDVKGTGLGLAIVQHIVQAHGGEVRVESELGVGSTFSIHLPIAVDETSAVSAESTAAVVESAPRLQQSG